MHANKMAEVRNRNPAKRSDKTEMKKRKDLKSTGEPKNKVSVKSRSIKRNRSLYLKLFLFFLYVLPPFALKYSRWLQMLIVYVHFIPLPMHGNLSIPEEFGLNNTRHLCFFPSNSSSLCAWHVLPAKYSGSQLAQFSEILSDGSPIVVYSHGNTGSRAVPHRVDLYGRLASYGYHVVTFDYRGFGDSKGIPSEAGLTEDLKMVYDWILTQNVSLSKIYLYGHSLGSAPVSHLASQLSQNGVSLGGVILDAPYTTIREAAYYHPFGLPYWPVMSIFMKPFVMDMLHEEFPVVRYVRNISCPILIFHGRKDIIIPWHLGYQVYQSALLSGKSSKVLFHDCGNSLHKNNYLSPVFDEALNSFIKQE